MPNQLMRNLTSAIAFCQHARDNIDYVLLALKVSQGEVTPSQVRKEKIVRRMAAKNPAVRTTRKDKGTKRT